MMQNNHGDAGSAGQGATRAGALPEPPAAARPPVTPPIAAHRLCYVSAPWAYFTNLPLDQQWGDDWNDAPYEHNAETPYADSPGQIVKVAFDGPLDEPRDGHVNSPWSVQAINAGATPWLRSSAWISHRIAIRIMAGTTIQEFIDLVRKAGGAAYLAQGMETRRAETSEAQAPSRSDDSPTPEGGCAQQKEPQS